ncbi:MAG: cell division protein SepF [Nitrososphaerota archaeon]|nr:cell division protein SepF [Nitrososphaerota archaeon]MDG6939595.1 cell division protein SepF [Nitrososphaerota archaeon]
MLGAKQKESSTYLKAYPLRALGDIDKVKEDLRNSSIVILRITPLAQKSVDELKRAVEELYQYAEGMGGDIARLGEERIVITPPNVKIWRALAQ